MKRIVLLSLLLAVAACTEAPMEPTPVEAPPLANLEIQRGEFPFGYSWVDEDAGLRIIIGYDQAQACRGGPPELDPVSFAEAEVGDRVVNRISGTVTTAVWGFTEFDCARFTTEEPLAQGESRIFGLTNDLFGTGANNPTIAILTARGRLTRTADGRSTRLSALYKLLAEDGSILRDPPTFSRIRLR